MQIAALVAMGHLCPPRGQDAEGPVLSGCLLGDGNATAERAQPAANSAVGSQVCHGAQPGSSLSPGSLCPPLAIHWEAPHLRAGGQGQGSRRSILELRPGLTQMGTCSGAWGPSGQRSQLSEFLGVAQ